MQVSGKETGILVFIGIMILVIVGAGIFIFNSAFCELKARDMGIQSKYTMISGCLVSDTGKIWVPPERFRNIADE